MMDPCVSPGWLLVCGVFGCNSAWYMNSPVLSTCIACSNCAAKRCYVLWLWFHAQCYCTKTVTWLLCGLWMWLWYVTCVCGSCHEHMNKWPWPPTGLALSLNDHEVKIYKKNGTKWQETDTLGEHGQRVTGIDWAPKSNRIVTCGAVSTLKLHATYMFMASI